MAETKLQIY